MLCKRVMVSDILIIKPVGSENTQTKAQNQMKRSEDLTSSEQSNSFTKLERISFIRCLKMNWSENYEKDVKTEFSYVPSKEDIETRMFCLEDLMETSYGFRHCHSKSSRFRECTHQQVQRCSLV
ncbi:hypothetical protein RND81_12G106400 [Saponaria officinalis]|uniref:Uncharacterized protein n=1 Tax=Saponaria officinalis TaxID=3572 RepID=A0AAW1H8Z4_SAPOF